MNDLSIIKQIKSEINQINGKGILDEKSVKVESNFFYSFNDRQRVISLRVRNLDCKIVPKSINLLKYLSLLDLSDNQIENLNLDVSLKHLRSLYLANNKLKNLDSILSFRNLSYLEISNNKLKSLEKLNKLSKLHYLDISGNQISDIEPIGRLYDLYSLRMSNNRITRLDPIKILKKLSYLNASENNISDLSPISDLHLINELFLSQNKIVSVSSLKSLTSLIVLDISNNLISEFDQLKNLNNLDKINLKGNEIKEIPEWIVKFNIEIASNELKNNSILIGGNPIELPPIEIIKQGKSSILNYFREYNYKETIKLYEAKLLLVGGGDVGKTWLLNKIYKNITPQTATTEGIKIHKWVPSLSSFVDKKSLKFKDLRINLWDFGGQEIYHATHQFFLTRRSLYLFVWDARKDDDLVSFDYWLNIIRLLSSNSPMIVVMAKSDIRIKNIEEATLQKKFDNIVAFHKVSSLKGTGINELRKDIISQINLLPHIGDNLPKVWFDIRQELESLSQNYVDFKFYLNICKKYGLTSSRARYLSKYFHDLGIFLHFHDNQVLSDRVFLKPDWATTAVYKILDTKKIQQNCGVFTFNELYEYWVDYDEVEYKYFIELMLKFEICFKLNENEYIVPEQLEKDAPNFQWDETNNLQFEFHYDFMPAGIITRFIARNNLIIKDNTYWKYGAILVQDQTSALVICEPLNRKIRIWSRGPEAKELLYLVRTDIKKIHESLNQPAVEEMIPCICNECKKRNNPYFHDFKTLKFLREEKGIFSRQCGISGLNINIDEIIGNLSVNNEDFKITYNKTFIFNSNGEEDKELKYKKWYQKVWGIIVIIGIILSVLAAIAQISGYSIRDVYKFDNNNEIQIETKVVNEQIDRN